MHNDRPPSRPRRPRPLIAVIDTCVLVVSHHMRIILGAALDGHVMAGDAPLQPELMSVDVEWTDEERQMTGA